MTQSDIEIWHNPRCSKSRAALAYLEERGLQPTVRAYLKDSPDAEAIAQMLSALGQPAANLLRKDGAALKNQPEANIIAGMVQDPTLIERPVVRRGDKAVIARPTELLDELFG